VKAALKQRVIRNVAWLTGLVVVLVVLIGGSVARLSARRAQVSSLETEIEGVRGNLALGSPEGDRATQLAAEEARLFDWQEMIGSESMRIDELTAAARTSGVTLTSLKSAELKAVGEGLLTRSHRVRGVGGYRQLASFLDAIYGARGMAAVDELKIAPEEDAGPGVLSASLRVTWLASDPDAVLEPGEAVQ
jgi:Tfp pilus assembly protein PilO